MIDLLPDDDQQAVLDNLAEVLAAEAPVARLRDGASEDPSLYHRLAALGWIGMGLPEAAGGVGYGLAEEVLLFRAAGRHLLSPTFLAGALAARLAASSGHHDLARSFALGEATACLLSAGQDVEMGDAVSGRFHRLDGVDSDHAIILTRAGFALLDNGDLDAVLVKGLDDAVRLDRVDLVGHPVRAWSSPSDERLDLHAEILIAAMQVGCAEGARDLAVAYAGMREQFGQPIGAFQAVKHHCADMAVRCEAAWSLTVFAALALQDQRPDAEFQVLSARLIADNAAVKNSAKGIQVHGGIGFTAECDAQLFLKRSRLWEALGEIQSARLGRLLALPEPVRTGRRSVPA